MIHGLKTHPEYFEQVISGKKSFEARENDRDFREGDYLALNEYDGEEYTGRSCMVYVDYILDEPAYVKEGYVIMGIKPCVVNRITSPYSHAHSSFDYSVPLTE